MMRFRYLIIAVITLVVADLTAQGSKNILRIRFDTVSVTAPTSNVVLNVWWQIDGTKPHNWRGFDCRLAYEKYQIAAVDAVELGTACATASLFHFERDVYPYQGEARLQVLTSGDLELDLSKPVLFRLVFRTNATLFDTVAKDYRGLMECFRFEVIGTGIDSVEIENGWIQYVPPVVPDPDPPKKRNIVVSTDSVTVQADSLVRVALNVSSLDSAMLKYGKFLFSYDTTVLAFVSTLPGDFALGTLLTDSKPGDVRITFTAADTSKPLAGAGELFTMLFHALKREDTVCTILRDTAFFALNDSALIDTIFYSLGPICVEGLPEQKDVVDRSREQQLLIALPNPAREKIKFTTDEARSCDLVIWNVLGDEVMRSALAGTLEIDTRHWMPGIYRAGMLKDGRILEDCAFIIVH